MRLASSGYGGGDPERVMRMRGDVVLAALEYEKFQTEYQDVFLEMNREG